MGQRMKRDWLDDKDVIQMLRAEVERAGSQRAFAIKVGLNGNNVTPKWIVVKGRFLVSLGGDNGTSIGRTNQSLCSR